MTENEQLLKIQPRLVDRWWRLNNLYYITDQYGKRVLFKLNAVQTTIYEQLHFLNTILKSRQHGVTTLFCILMLDFILWNQNKEAAMTMHGMTEAKGKFATHIKYPFFELPDYILNTSIFKPKSDSQTELVLPDEKGNLRSKLSVQAGLRSGTYHWVHVSEYAKLCAKYPEKAAEVQSGAIETIHQGMILTFESTAEGPSGDFFDKCRQAEQRQREHKPLGPMDYKYFFFGWYWKESNTTDPQYVDVTPEEEEYFDKIEEKEDVPDSKLTPGQRAWYVKKHESLGILMTREHPSTSDEAWFASVKGSFWADEIRDLETRFPPQITTVPFNPKMPVHTVHDVGFNWAIWFIQDPIGVYPKFIRYYEFAGGGVERCCELLDDFKKFYGYRYGKHIVPLDADSNATKTINGLTILINARKNGYTFSKMKKVPDSIDLIEKTRMALTEFWFDRENCKEGLSAAVSFRRVLDKGVSTDKNPIYLEKYYHDWSSHGSTALYHFVKARSSGKFRSYDTDATSMTSQELMEMNRLYARPRSG